MGEHTVESEPYLPQRITELTTALENRERQIEALRRTSDALFSHTSVEEMVRETLTIALDVLCADAGTLYLHDAANDALVFRYVVGSSADKLIGTSIPASQGIAGQVFRTGVPDLTRNVSEHGQHDRTIDAKTGYHTRATMTVPVKRPDSAPIGVMQVLNTDDTAFDSRDLEVLQVLCAQAATAIEQARLAQEARRAEIVNVIGDISHDIKNMLTPIQSGVWTLTPMLDQLFEDLDAIRARCPENEDWGNELGRVMAAVREDYTWMLEGANDAATAVQARTKEIADAVKGELAPPFFEEADLNETVGEVLTPLRLVAERAGVFLKTDLDPDLPRAEFDRSQMRNALYNLVNNAIPETPEGGSVTVRTRRPAPEEDTICVEVQDTGKGIPDHVRKRLFTDEAVSTKPGGTGLGTRFVGGVVRRHNGAITVDSQEGRGSTFTIRFPLRHKE